MADVDLTNGNAGTVDSWQSDRGNFYREAILDFAETNRSAGDNLKLWDIPAGTFIDHVMVDVMVAEGAVATADVGDTATDNTFFEAADLNTAGKVGNILPANGLGAFYATATMFEILLNHAMDTGKIRVVVMGRCAAGDETLAEHDA